MFDQITKKTILDSNINMINRLYYMENRLFKAPQIHLSNVLTLWCIIALHSFSFSQNDDSFTGMLVYKITARDTNMRKLIPENQTIIYTNDTIVRTENSTGQFGKQVVIKHMMKNKSYLLLDTPLGKFAIKADHSLEEEAIAESKYSFKKKWFKTKVLGRKAKRILVSHKDFTEPIEFLYYKKVSSKYNDIFPEIPGLVVKYSLPTHDGVLDFELIKYSEYTPKRDLFGIPSDYKKITFDEFVDLMTGGNSIDPK